MPAKRARWSWPRFLSPLTRTSATTRRPRVFEDLVKAGVIDPTKVTRTALQNAASIAGLLLTTEALVVEIPEPKSAPAGGGHGGGMDGMY